MSADERYICAFPGRRDAYQVPVALAEHSRLELFLTDFYWSGPVAWAGEKMLDGNRLRKARGRQAPAIPPARVRVLWSSSARRKVDELRGWPPGLRYSLEGIRFAEAARDAARLHRAHLFLYPPGSHEAFTASYPRHQPRRVLFQFHPHPGYQERVLRADADTYPEVAASFREESWRDLPPALQARDADGWRDADLIFCASSFTRDTLLEAGADPGRCRVVCYGVDSPSETAGDLPPPRPGFHALFVGTGLQRKGLHHLLAAWKTATMPADSSLTIVARHHDPGLSEILAASPRTTLLAGGISAERLRALYAESTLFVMPSLLEGFGAVYLEAMCRGCPVLGTARTCLPDIGTENEGVFLAPVADSTALAGRLEELAGRLPGNLALRRRAADRAAGFTWERFRRELVGALDHRDGHD